MKILFITNEPINLVGGLERSSNFFINWLKKDSHNVVNINKKNFFKIRKIFFSCDLIFLIGHRSIFILLLAIFSYLFKKKVAWCPFWHDYKIEKKKFLFLYKIYDVFFLTLFKKANFNIVVSHYEALKIAEKNRTRKIILPNFISTNKEELLGKREIDVLIPGRDVPHKRFELIKYLCKEIGLTYLETNKNYLSENDLRKAYLSSKFILIPSLYESYSYVALEGMSCGCNVLVSDAVMVKYELKKYNNFKILNNDLWNPELVRNILNSFPSNKKNINNALEIQSRFSSDACMEKFLSGLDLR